MLTATLLLLISRHPKLKRVRDKVHEHAKIHLHKAAKRLVVMTTKPIKIF